MNIHLSTLMGPQLAETIRFVVQPDGLIMISYETDESVKSYENDNCNDPCAGDEDF